MCVQHGGRGPGTACVFIVNIGGGEETQEFLCKRFIPCVCFLFFFYQTVKSYFVLFFLQRCTDLFSFFFFTNINCSSVIEQKVPTAVNEEESGRWLSSSVFFVVVVVVFFPSVEFSLGLDST